MLSSYLLVRVVHVVLGAFWAGATFFVALYLTPAVEASGPVGTKVMGQVMRRGWLKAVLTIGTLVILTGLYLMWQMSAGFSPAFMGSKPGILLSLGMLAGFGALAIGFFGTAPTARRMGALMAKANETGSAPDAETLAEVGRLSKRLGKLVRVLAAHLAVALVLMALAPHM